jgi:hypothetical protein
MDRRVWLMEWKLGHGRAVVASSGCTYNKKIKPRAKTDIFSLALR